MDRRDALKTVLGYCGGTACSGVLGGLAMGCESKPSPQQGVGGQLLNSAKPTGRKPSFQPQLLSAEQALTLEDLTEHIIPETTTPGAKQAGVAEQIELQLREVLSAEEAKTFLKGLDAVSARATMLHKKLFHQCDAQTQASLFSQMVAAVSEAVKAGSATPFFTSLRRLTIQSFCESKLGATRVLQYESVPGGYKACVSLESIGRAWATR